jgi:threonine synthase
MTNKFHYKCIDCGEEYHADKVRYVCPLCSQNDVDGKPPKGVLKVEYQYEKIKKFGFEQLEKNQFIDLLPLNSIDSLPNLRVGKTPLYVVDELDGSNLGFSLLLKDDSQNPTFSYKDRASAVVSAFAKENGIDTIVAASTGNAGSSLAGICAAQNQKAIIMVPAAAPVAKLTQIIMYGATLIPVAGTYDDAFDLSVKATEELGWYNRNTAFNPLTIEGKKTSSFEIFSQMNHQIPDRLFVPVGDGVIISGIYKGFEDLHQLGWIEKMPVIVGVQSEGSDNIARNIQAGSFTVKPSNTIADSISVDIPRNFNMAKQFIKKYKGETIIISDEEIMQASKILSENTGIFAEPAAATAFGGILKYNELNKIAPNSKNLVMLTGSGLKDLKSIQSLIQMPEPIAPSIDNLKKLTS